MPLFRWLQRKKQSGGHGIHSPFAYHLITNVVRSPFTYYAFSDIREIVAQNGLDTDSITEFNHLSYRLVREFNAKNILEIHSGKGVNTLFLLSSAPDIRCVCVEDSRKEIAIAKRLQKSMGIESEFVPTVSSPEKQPFDAIFINLKENNRISVETLMEWSHEDTFWVIHPIKNKWSKQFWRNIVKDERARIMVDMRKTGIVFLRPSYRKATYFV